MDLHRHQWQAYQQGLQPSATDSWQNEDDEESQLFSSSEEQSQLSSVALFDHSQVSGIPIFEPPQPPQVINIQQHVDHSNRRHSQPAAIYRGISSITSGDILSAGLSYAGFGLDRQRKNNLVRKTEWFKAFYGVEQHTVTPFFEDLRNEYPDILFKDCLLTMNWLALYETYIILSGRWKYCEEYIGSKVIDYATKMAKVARKKIIFELEHNIENGRTVDCSTFMVQEFRLDPSIKWFDYKTHSCGLKYEFCLAIREPRVVWISGPHGPSIHDITVFRGGDAKDGNKNWDQKALYFQLEEGEKCVADSGYAGEPSKIVMTKDEHSSEFKEFMARAKNRQETFHWRLKSFNILGHRFRHGVNTKDRMKLHKMAVDLVAGIVQYDYENGHPPFDIC